MLSSHRVSKWMSDPMNHPRHYKRNDTDCSIEDDDFFAVLNILPPQHDPRTVKPYQQARECSERQIEKYPLKKFHIRQN